MYIRTCITTVFSKRTHAQYRSLIYKLAITKCKHAPANVLLVYRGLRYDTIKYSILDILTICMQALMYMFVFVLFIEKDLELIEE
jgi:hypothetical protein